MQHRSSLHTPSWLQVACCLVLSLAMSGCRSGRLATYYVQGKVVFEDGSPVKLGTVEFKSRTHGIQSRGTINSQGEFTLTTYEPGDGAVLGIHDAVVVQFVPTERLKNFRGSPLGVIHSRYASYATSELSGEVSAVKMNNITLQVTGILPPKEQHKAARRHDEHDHQARPAK